MDQEFTLDQMQPIVYQQLQRSFEHGRLAHAYLFEGEKGTNPEELIGAAHAACFSMALSLMLGEAGFTPTSIDTTADVSLDKVDAGFAITKIALKSEVAVPGIDASTFDGIIQKAKAGCPVSQVLKAEITLDYQLKS